MSRLICQTWVPVRAKRYCPSRLQTGGVVIVGGESPTLTNCTISGNSTSTYGGGVYSAAREQSRLLAVIGALLLVANFTVTAAMSGWAAMSYFRVPKEYIGPATMGLMVFVGAMNYFGPKHTGSAAIWLAIPMVAVVFFIGAFALPHLTTVNFEPFSMT